MSRRTETSPPRPTLRSVSKVVVRALPVVGIMVIAAIVLNGIFDELDIDAVLDTVAGLSDAETISLLMGWLIWIGAQGLQSASLVDGLPARRGVLAFLGPTAVASLIPGPSDLPVRYSLYQSWGISRSEAGTAIAANGIFSVGSQLMLPAFAGLAIVVTGVQMEGFLGVIVTATLILAVLIVLLAVVAGSAERTRRVASRLDPVMRTGFRIVRREPPEEDLGSIAERQRNLAVEHLRNKWLPASGATVLAIAAKCSILIVAVRFVGIPEDTLGWPAIFAAFALVAGLTAVPITPGSAGVADVALIGMLIPVAGTSYANEVAAGVLLYRLLTWILVIPAGLLALVVWRRRYQRAG